MANPIVERYTRNDQRQTEARRRPGRRDPGQHL